MQLGIQTDVRRCPEESEPEFTYSDLDSTIQ